MEPLKRFCGNVNKPGTLLEPSSNFGASCLITKPLALPSIPGQGRSPAPLFHSAEQTLAVKSYPEPIGESPATLISTQIGLAAFVPMPNKAPLALLSIQYPRYFPAEAGAIILTVMSTVAPGAVFHGRLTEVGAPICS